MGRLNIWLSSLAYIDFAMVNAILNEDSLPVNLGVNFDTWIRNNMLYIEEWSKNATELVAKH